MGIQPTVVGNNILQQTFKVGAAAGLTPFRCVILDPTNTTPLGGAWLPEIKYPNHSFTSLETLLGVIVDPVSESSGALNTIAENRAATVRMLGTVPVMSDDTTTATPILVNDYVRSSTSGAGTQGQIAKAARSTNTFTASQHLLGVALTSVTVNNRYSLVKLAPFDV